MILLPLNPGTYAGRKFTVRYQTTGLFDEIYLVGSAGGEVLRG